VRGVNFQNSFALRALPSVKIDAIFFSPPSLFDTQQILGRYCEKNDAKVFQKMEHLCV
jgi:hypothetical protein